MRPSVLALTCLILARMGVFGQAADAPSFEVASVKPASPSATGRTISGGPGTADPGVWSGSNIPLAFLISNAYGFQPYQFNRRDSCCQAGFDITAKVTVGTTKEQFLRMQQRLLEERFKLAFHLERKEMAIYELTVGERGVKLQESAPGASSEPEDPWGPPEYSIGKDGYPVFPAGRSGLAGPNGHYRWTGFNVSVQEIARTLSNSLGRPVVDATGLKGRYDVDMKWGVDVALLLEMAGRRDEVGELPDTGPTGPNLIRAVQDQLGLKLNSKKGAGDIVVIDHVEKIPSKD